MKIAKYRFILKSSFIYLRGRLYQLHRCIFSVGKRIQNITKPSQKKKPNSAQHIQGEEMDDLYTRNQNQQKEFAQSKLSFTNCWLVNSFSCQVQFFSTTSFFMSFLPHSKSGIFSGIFQGQQIHYLPCFLIMLKGILSNKYSGLLLSI